MGKGKIQIIPDNPQDQKCARQLENMLNTDRYEEKTTKKCNQIVKIDFNEEAPRLSVECEGCDFLAYAYLDKKITVSHLDQEFPVLMTDLKILYAEAHGQDTRNIERPYTH